MRPFPEIPDRSDEGDFIDQPGEIALATVLFPYVLTLRPRTFTLALPERSFHLSLPERSFVLTLPQRPGDS